MKCRIRVFIVLMVCLFGVPLVGHAATINVSTAGQLTTALGTAVAGDEIVLANGTYTGEFAINGNSGTSDVNRITLRAANRHQAIIDASVNGCSWNSSDSAFEVSRAYWTIKDLKIINATWGIYVCGPRQCGGGGGHHITIQDTIIDNRRGVGIMLSNGADNSLVERNVIGHVNYSACAGTPNTDSLEIYLSAFITMRENITLPTGSNGYACGGGGGCAGGGGAGELGGDLGASGFGILSGDNDLDGPTYLHDNTIQGNVVMEGGRGGIRVFNGYQHQVLDNMVLWTKGGGYSTDHCFDHHNTFKNNIGYGNYYLAFSTKGNNTGTLGDHVWQHNLSVHTAFSRDGLEFGSGTGCVNGGPKINLHLLDNLVYSEQPLLSQGSYLIGLDTHTPILTQMPDRRNNLFWADSNTSTYSFNYVYDATDIHAQGSVPQFVDAAHGDFSLVPNTLGTVANGTGGTDGANRGIAYNTYLKKAWMANAFNLPTQQHNGLTTSTSFTVDPNHYYQVWFYIPTSYFAGFETFTVEGQQLGRDINGLNTGAAGIGWVQSSGPQRWITLGRHKATDGVLNISWTNPGSASQIFIRQIPTADEAYAWIAGSTSSCTSPMSGAPYAPSTLVTCATPNASTIEQHGASSNGADGWSMSWDSTGALYALWGDGMGWQSDHVNASYGADRWAFGGTRISGNPGGLTGVDMAEYDTTNNKSGVFVAESNGTMIGSYNSANDSPAWNYARAMSSSNNGTSWTFTGTPIFCATAGAGCPSGADGVMPLGMLQSGQGYTVFPAHVDGNYYYTYLGMSHEQPFTAGTNIYLARVPKASFANRAAYEYVSAVNGAGVPTWSSNFAAKVPVLTDTNGFEFVVGVTWFPAWNRFLLVKGQTGAGCSVVSSGPSGCFLGMFESLNPWGPWKTIYYGAFQGTAWKFSYQTPQKWMASDGTSFWLMWSGDRPPTAPVDYDNFNLIRFDVTLAALPDTTVPNVPANLRVVSP